MLGTVLVAPQLTPSDQEVIEVTRRRLGVLRNVKPGELRFDTDFIDLGCGDSRHFREKYSYLDDIRKLTSGEGEAHEIRFNGGALVAAKDSPINPVDLPSDLVMLHQIFQAREIKSAETVLLTFHYPCAAASSAGLSIIETIAYGVAAKLRVKHHWLRTLGYSKRRQIVLLCHIDYGIQNGRHKKRFYHVSREKTLDMLSRRVYRDRYPGIYEMLVKAANELTIFEDHLGWSTS